MRKSKSNILSKSLILNYAAPNVSVYGNDDQKSNDYKVPKKLENSSVKSLSNHSENANLFDLTFGRNEEVFRVKTDRIKIYFK